MRQGWIVAALCLLLSVPAFGQKKQSLRDSGTEVGTDADCVKLGKDAMDKGDYNTALAWLSEAIRRDPRNVEAYRQRAVPSRTAKATSGKRSPTWTAPSKSIRPASTPTWTARLCGTLGDLEHAVTDCNHVIYLQPRPIEALALRGRLYFLKGQYEKTIADLTETIRLDPNHSLAYTYRGAAYGRWASTTARSLMPTKPSASTRPTRTVI